MNNASSLGFDSEPPVTTLRTHDPAAEVAAPLANDQSAASPLHFVPEPKYIWDEYQIPSSDFYPYWVPPRLEIRDWPLVLRYHVSNLINPLYFQLVLNQRPGLMQTIGLTVVHLTWLEVLDHLRIGAHVARDGHLATAKLATSNARERLIARHVKLISTKLAASQLLLRLREFKVRTRPAEGRRNRDDVERDARQNNEFPGL